MGAVCTKKTPNQKNSNSRKDTNILTPHETKVTLEKDDKNEKPNFNSNDRINEHEIHEPKMVASQIIPNPPPIQQHPLSTSNEQNLVDSVYGYEDASKFNSVRISRQKSQESNKEQVKNTLKFENMQKFESIIEKEETSILADQKIDNHKQKFGSSVQPSIPFERNQDSLKANNAYLKNTTDFNNLENTTELTKSNNQNLAFSEPPAVPAERTKLSRVLNGAHAHLMNPWENLGDPGDSDYPSPKFEQIEPKKYEENKDKIIYDKLRESDYYTPVGLENPEKELKFSKKNEISSDPKQKINHFSKYPLEESKEIEEYVDNAAFAIQKNNEQNNHNSKELRLSDISSSIPKKIEKKSSLKTNKREELNCENEQNNMMYDRQAIPPIPEEEGTQKAQSQSHSSSLLSILDEKDDNSNLNYVYNYENSGSHQTVEKEIEESKSSSLSEDHESENQINLVKSFSYNLKKKEPAPPPQRILFDYQHEEKEVKIQNLEDPKVDEEEKQEPIQRLNSQKKNELEEQKIEVIEKNERIERIEFGEKIEKTEKIEKNEKLEKVESKKKPSYKKKFKSENVAFQGGAWLEDREETKDENGANCIEMFGTFIPEKKK